MQIAVDGVMRTVELENFSSIELGVAEPLPRNASGGFSFTFDLEARERRTPDPDEPEIWLDIAGEDLSPLSALFDSMRTPRRQVDLGTFSSAFGALAAASSLGRPHAGRVALRSSYEADLRAQCHEFGITRGAPRQAAELHGIGERAVLEALQQARRAISGADVPAPPTCAAPPRRSTRK